MEIEPQSLVQVSPDRTASHPTRNRWGLGAASVVLALAMLTSVVGRAQAHHAFELRSSALELTCGIGDPNCSIDLTATNVSGEPLRRATFYGSGVEFQDSEGNWVRDQREVGLASVSQTLSARARLIPADVPGVQAVNLYIDGQTCNPRTEPDDCMFIGGSSVTIAFTTVA